MSSRVLILFLLMLFIPSAINAAESDNDFDIELMSTEGKPSFSQGYFNIVAEPGQDITVNMRIKNNTDQPLELLIESADASTAEEGGILYSTTPFGDAAEQSRLSDLMEEIQESVTIPANGVEEIHYHIDAPLDASGTVLGGILFTDTNNSEASSSKLMHGGETNYTIKKQGQQLIAVKLDFPDHSASSFSLGKVRFNNGSLTVKVSNSNLTVAENVHGTYTIMDKDGETMVSGDITPFAMVPKSDIRYSIDLKGQIFEEGKYVLMIKGSADKKEFFAEEMFTVSESHSAALAGETSSSAPPASDAWNYAPAIALTGLLLVLPLVLKLFRRNIKNPSLDLSEKNNQ